MVRRKEIKSTMDSSKYLTYIFNEAEKDIERLTKQIAQCEKQMVELLQSSKELSKNYKHVLSIPGIGLIKREFDISTSLLNMSMSQPEHVLQHKEARKYR